MINGDTNLVDNYDYIVGNTFGMPIKMSVSTFSLDEVKNLTRPVIISRIDLHQEKRLKDLLSRHVDRQFNYKKIKRRIVEEHDYNNFNDPEYDLAEITTLVDVESYVLRGFRKRLAHMFKDDFDISGDNKRNVEYINKRLAEIAFFTGITTRELFKDIANYYITRSNVIVVKVRRKNLGSGRIRRSIDNKILQPVVGYFVIDPSFVQVKFDKYHNITTYRIFASDRSHYRDYNPSDIIHLYKNKKYTDWSGTPDLVPAMADIATLRQIEENIELYFYQHLFPLYHYKVGDENQDATLYPDGTREIDVVRQEIQYMPTEGCIVTPQRHTIEPLQEKGKFSAIKEIHEIFKTRVFAALGMSDIDFGAGSVVTRASANTLSMQLIDDVKDELKTLSDLIKKDIFTELLLEAPFAYNPFNKSEQVNLVFPELDKDYRLQLYKVLTAAVDKNVVSMDEARIELGYKPYGTETWKNTAWRKYQKALAKIEHPTNTSTESIQHVKDDTTQANQPQNKATNTETPNKQKTTQKPNNTGVKPKPKVTITTKKTVKSNYSLILDMTRKVFMSVVNNKVNDLNEEVSKLEYYTNKEFCNDFKRFLETTIESDMLDDDKYIIGRYKLLEYMIKNSII